MISSFNFITSFPLGKDAFVLKVKNDSLMETNLIETLNSSKWHLQSTFCIMDQYKVGTVSYHFKRNIWCVKMKSETEISPVQHIPKMGKTKKK